MDKCACDGDENKYYSIGEWDCVDKIVGKKYGHNASIHATNCIDICEAVENGYGEDPDCGSKKIILSEILGEHKLKILKIFLHLILNINEFNELTKILIIPTNLEEYEHGMALLERKFGKESCDQLKRNKILFQGSLNTNLADIVNIYACVLFVIFKDNADFDLEQIYNAMFDLGCSVGSINVFEQTLMRKYDLGEPILLNSISIVEFKEVLQNIFIEMELLININEASILSTVFIEGDKMGGEGGGEYNDKYKFFYLIKLLTTNKLVSVILSRQINIKRHILEYYSRVVSRFADYSFEIKYNKYKKKYLLLKEKLGL